MSLVVNNNLMAANTARTLNQHYGRLQTSTERLSSGLRINSAADDAAGLAIRELQRADIAALHQGARNANDAISMIQTADGALGVIDEKLIRMKELAEQAATGTYDSTQRLMIESEYQAMASEITRIANATDFNGTKLLDGTLDGDHDGSGLVSQGKMKIHFGTGNDSAEDYYYITVGECTAQAFGVGNASSWNDVVNRASKTFEQELVRIYKTDNPGALANLDDMVGAFTDTLKASSIPTADNWDTLMAKWNALDDEQKAKFWPSQQQFPASYDEYTKLSSNQQIKVQYAFGRSALTDYENTFAGIDDQFEAVAKTPYAAGDTIQCYTDEYETAYQAAVAAAATAGTTAPTKGATLQDAAGKDIQTNTDEWTKIQNALGTPPVTDGADYTITQADIDSGKIGGMTAEDVVMQAAKAASLAHRDRDFAGFTVETQEDAQHALEAINDAIVQKDKIRAHLGATQNRLENTITNLNIQAENLQAAESRISDVDVATEMTQFVRNQILTQSAVAMLGQANSLPQMAMQLIGG